MLPGRWRCCCHFCRLALFVVSLALLAPCRAQETALDRYVAEPDAAYGYELVGSSQGLGYTRYLLEMTSQTWRSPEEVNRTTWKHWLTIIVPSTLNNTTALLFVDGGSNDGELPSVEDIVPLALVAISSGAIVADLEMVPNQPLVFSGETRERSEDAILAYSWDKYLRTGDEKWPAQLPMTKSAVRAMDAVTAFCAASVVGNPLVEKFVVAGGSKRGWTTWLTAAVDQRVTAIIPMVIDLLNLEPSFRHHWRAYGFWAPAIQDYTDLGIMAWMGTPEYKALAEIVDPFSYRGRLTLPKYLICSSGDEFFLPDSSQFYFDELEGEKYLRYVPNTGHSLENSDAIVSAMGFFQAILAGTPLPHFSWDMTQPGKIVLNTVDAPAEVKLWQATNPTARDFRINTIGPAWTSTAVESSGHGVWEASLPEPVHGWTAFFLEMTYPGGALKFTTPVKVIPDTLPYLVPFASVLAASSHPLTAPGSIASGYGQDLASLVEAATELPLPRELAGVSVRITDARAVEHTAPLFFVSPGQINYLVPAGTATGVATVEVVREQQRVTAGQLLVDPVAPGLFSANGDGRGVAAAIAVTGKADGSRVWQYVFDPNAPEGNRHGVPISLGETGDRVYLSLFGTGMRNAVSAGATVGGKMVAVAGPVSSPEYRGVEQLNLGPLPRSLSGAGEVDVVVKAGGKTANVVTVVIE